MDDDKPGSKARSHAATAAGLLRWSYGYPINSKTGEYHYDPPTDEQVARATAHATLAAAEATAALTRQVGELHALLADGLELSRTARRWWRIRPATHLADLALTEDKES